MIFEEFCASDRLVSTKLVVSIVEGGEHFKEAKAALFGVLQSTDHVRVPRSIEVILNLFNLEGTVAVRIQLIEGLVAEALADRVQLSAKGSQKFIKTDLAIATGIKDVEETFSIASAHSWDAIVVEDGLELAETELSRAICVHDSELLLEIYEALCTSRGNSVFK